VNTEFLAITMFGMLLILVIAGVPLFLSLGGLGLIFGLIGWGPIALSQFINRIYGIMANEVLPAVPLFIFMGYVLERSGAAEKLFGTMHVAMGSLRGGIALATVLICTLFAACTGIVGASVTTMGLLALPPMIKRGYNKSLATGCICAGGTLGILIPPSIMLVLYGPMAALSVSKLFMGAVVPGLVLSALYLTYISVRCLLQPSLAPVAMAEEKAEIRLGRLALQLLRYLIPPLFLILAVMGSIFFGVCAITEAAAMGAFGAILVAAAYRRLNWKMLKESVYLNLKTTSMVMFVTIGAVIFSGVFMALGGGDLIGGVLLGLPFGKWGILAALMVVIVVLGMFIDWIGILFIVVPVFTPIGVALGFDPLWFALVICVNLQMSFLTPPFAYAMFYLKGVAPPDVTMADIYRGVIPFVLLQAIGLGLVIIFPTLALWLPGLMYS